MGGNYRCDGSGVVFARVDHLTADGREEWAWLRCPNTFNCHGANEGR